MKYEFKKLPDSIIEIEAALDHQEFLSYWETVHNQALASVNLKGFRPGAAPKELAEGAVDKEKIFQEAASEAINDNLKKIIEENGWQLVDQTKVEVLESQVGLKFKAVIVVFPEIKLGNYQKIAKRILKDGRKDISVGEDEIQKSIQWALNSRTKLIRVAREAKTGDAVIVNFSGSVDGQTLEELSRKDEQLILGEKKFPLEFEESVIGRKEGESWQCVVSFPGNYRQESLRNKKVDFQVALREIFERETPELTDEFVKGLGKFENVESFRNSVKEGLLKEKLEKEKEKLRLKMMDEIIKDSKIELPKVMVERVAKNMMEEYKSLLSQLDKKDIKSGQEIESRIEKQIEAKAQNSVAANLALYQIAKEQGLEPTDEEIEKEANVLLKDKIDSDKLYDYIYGEVRNRKVFNYLELRTYPNNNP